MSWRNSIFLFAATGFYILLRTIGVTGSDLWHDEVFSVLSVNHSWAEMFSIIVRDGVHPPLFYVLLKVWSLGSDSIRWLQLFPYLVSILTLVPLYLFCRELKLAVSETAVVFLAIAVNGYFLEYALDLRMYGLLQFFTLFSLWSFARLQQSSETRQSIIWLLAFFNLLLVYTHYFGWLIIGLEGLYLLLRQRRYFFSFAVSSALVLLGFAPWIWLVSQKFAGGGTTGNLDWLTRPSAADVIWFYATLNGNLDVPHTTVVNVLIFAFPACVYNWQTIRRKLPDTIWQLLFFFAFAPVLIIFSLSYLLPKSIWETRYLIICAAPYTVLIVKSVFALPNRLLRSIFIGVISIWFLLAGFFSFSQAQNKIRWSAAAEEISTAGGDASQVVYVFDEWVETPLRFYLRERKVPAQVERRVEVNELQEKTFWLAVRNSTAEENQRLREELREKGCRVTNEKNFSDALQSVALLRVEDCH